MKQPDPYRIADRVQESLTKRALKRLNRAKRNLTVLGFDELNVFQETQGLYEYLNEDAKSHFRALYAERYMEVLKWMGKKRPPSDDLDELVDLWLIGFLGESNPVTHYIFDTEVIRKRDRAVEAVNSVPTKVQKQLELDKALRIFLQMESWYTDMASQDAELQALKDAGVRRVKWNAYGDDRVCNACESLDGQVFDIDSVPDRPHPNCRCYLTPA